MLNSLMLLSPVLKRIRFDVVFIVNIAKRSEDESYQGRNTVLPGAVMRLPGKGIGLGVGRYISNKNLKTNKKACDEFISEGMSHSSRFYALSGVMPGAINKHGIQVNEKKVCINNIGTTFMILKNIEEALKTHPYLENKPVAIVGQGTVGEKIAEKLEQHYPLRTFDIDAKINKAYFMGNKFQKISECGLVILLTTEGDDGVRSIFDYLNKEHVILSDTHPKISKEMWGKLSHKNLNGYECAATHRDFSIFPTYPEYNSKMIPGCLLEAVVSSHSGQKVDDFDEFITVAEKLRYESYIHQRAKRVDDGEKIHVNAASTRKTKELVS